MFDDQAFTVSVADGSPLPISFTLENLTTGITDPTSIVWGADERLYVGTQGGTIHALTVDDDYNLVSSQTINTIAGLSNMSVLGLAFSPFEAPGVVRLYVSHSQLYANGGTCFAGFSPYSGQISILEGPDFDTLEALITELPVSNHDHGINGLDFDHNGDLYICLGGNTNAGVPACPIGDLPESPLSGAVIKAEISRRDFNGQIVYVETASGAVNQDQVFGNIVDLDDDPAIHVFSYGHGLRNPYDLVFTTQSLLFATDNGPNVGFGPASTGPSSQGPDPGHPDELCLIEFWRYYGHPNRNRGRFDYRQNVYHHEVDPEIIGVFTQQITGYSSSTNGIVEYRSATFNQAMRGDLVAQRLNSSTYRITLAADGRSVIGQVNFPVSLGSLDLTTAPGGVVLGAAHGLDKVVIAKPNETAPGMRAYDIFPWRAPAAGGNSFVIGGKNFGTLSSTTVTLGGVATTLTSVTPTRIRGVIPASSNPTRKLLDVIVTVGSDSRLLPKAFRYLSPQGSEPYGWRFGPSLPVALGEVASGIINGVLYVIGEGDPATLAYDLTSQTWSIPRNLAPRPFAGHHHMAEVVDGKLVLLGGLGSGSPGTVQIYDPVADSWSLGTPMPWAGGSCSSVLLDGEIYVSGGIVGSGTVTTFAKYNPAIDSWTPLADMPAGRNHAAAETDGSKMYVFGGRGPGSGDGNFVANGFANVQVYDPATNTWESSDDAGSTLAPLPQARGGTGTAVFIEGEFYVMGGETLNGPGATPTHCYDRVDIYDPVTNTWRIGPVMPVALHGLNPVLHNNFIYVAGGGTQAGNSQSTVFEIYAP